VVVWLGGASGVVVTSGGDDDACVYLEDDAIALDRGLDRGLDRDEIGLR